MDDHKKGYFRDMALMPRKSNQKITVHNRVSLVHGGAEFFQRMVDIIAGAERSIHLQTYILENDDTGSMIRDALVASSSRGVDVFVMVDGYASRNLDEQFIQHLFDSGIRFRYFEPVFQSRTFYFGRRLHHKVIVADGSRAMVGGVNISDRYNDLPGDPAWLDWAVCVYGEAAAELERLCVGRWVKFPAETERILSRQIPPAIHRDWHCPVRVQQNDWVTRRNDITRSYLQLLSEAKQDIIIMSSYFLPGRMFRRYMARASRRGVKIRLILAGTSDVKIAKQAERYMYRWLLRNKVEIYEYPQNVLHGKIAVCDRNWITAGSYNVNNISAYASIELNLDVLDPAFAGQVQDALLEIIERDCMRVTEKDYQTGFNVFQRGLQFASYELIRMIFFLFTFYFRQR